MAEKQRLLNRFLGILDVVLLGHISSGTCRHDNRCGKAGRTRFPVTLGRLVVWCTSWPHSQCPLRLALWRSCATACCGASTTPCPTSTARTSTRYT
eukprot:1195593-Prorocentrum_minimum.AAC.5